MSIYGAKGEDFSKRMKAITDSTEYKLAHDVLSRELRDTLRYKIQRTTGQEPILNVHEAQLLIEYIDFLESEVGLREPHLHFSGVTDAQVDAHNASIDDDAPSGIAVGMAEMEKAMRDNLIAQAARIASRGTQQSDGYDYLVPSKDLAETSRVIYALVAEVHKLENFTATSSVAALGKWLADQRESQSDTDLAARALKMLEWQKATIGSYAVIVREAREALGTGPEKNEGN